ncbi:hypothetical protein [Streptomyces sp. NPDC057002]
MVGGPQAQRDDGWPTAPAQRDRGTATQWLRAARAAEGPERTTALR